MSVSQQLEVPFAGGTSRFAKRLISRKDFFGYRKRIALDEQGRECTTALMTDDGRHILQNGCTAELYLNELGDVIERNKINSNMTGTMIEHTEKVREEELLEHVVKAVFILELQNVEPELKVALDHGSIFRTSHGSESNKTSFILKGSEDYFLLVMEHRPSEFVSPEQVMLFDEHNTDTAFDDDLWEGF